ncbi:hypothetical protein R1flu_028960 [Riccia fluitans]|uniref:Uncharacterized protein n=1 Tax=Riccia fluitans TaxID=41844 RepID=A0ABD1XN54_9MARC
MSSSLKGKTIGPLTQEKVFGRSPCQTSEDKSSLLYMIPIRDMKPIPGRTAIAIPYSYEELRPAFNRCYDIDKWPRANSTFETFAMMIFSKNIGKIREIKPSQMIAE